MDFTFTDDQRAIRDLARGILEKEITVERLQRLERARAPSFADALLAMPQDDGEFPRGNVRMRDPEL